MRAAQPTRAKIMAKKSKLPNVPALAGAHLEDFYLYVLGIINAPRTGKKFTLSASSLAKLHKNPLAFFLYVIDSKFVGTDDEEEDTRAMLVGSVFHSITLDQRIMSRPCQFAVEPQLPEVEFTTDKLTPMGNLTKEGKAEKDAFLAARKAEEQALFAAEKAKNPHVEFVDSDLFEEAQNYSDLLLGEVTIEGEKKPLNPKAHGILSKVFATEVDFIFKCPKSKKMVRGFIDFIGFDPATNTFFAGDLKLMTRAVDKWSMMREVRDRKLVLQAYVYKHAISNGIQLPADAIARAKALSVPLSDDGFLRAPIEQYHIIACGEKVHSNIHTIDSYEFAEGGKMYEEATDNFAHCILAGEGAFLQSY